MPSKIFLVCALYLEAKSFLTELRLKPKKAPSGFQLFANEVYELIVTGTGKVASACGTTFLINDCESSITACLNVGMCGTKNEPVGKIFLVDQITDEANGRTFYPDILQKTDLPRNVLHTVDRPDVTQSFEGLVDMEGSGFYEAASNFLTAEKIQLLKIVSDQADQDTLNRKTPEKIMKANLPAILEYAESFSAEEIRGLTESEEMLLRELFRKTHFTATQRIRSEQLAFQLKIQGADIRTIFCEIPIEGKAADILKSFEKTLQTY